MMALIEESKLIPTKPDVSEFHQQLNLPKVFNLHAQLSDKSMWMGN
jgi:hypothetical protein